MKLSIAGENFTKTSEAGSGPALTPYLDVNGTGIGYGHYYLPSVPKSQIPTSITVAQANAFFTADIATAVSGVIRGLTVPVTQQAFDGLVDYAYNKGVGGMNASGVLSAINSGNLSVAANIVASDVPKCGFKGLIPRRQHEAALIRGQATMVGGTYTFP